jgi:hypothetical protein
LALLCGSWHRASCFRPANPLTPAEAKVPIDTIVQLPPLYGSGLIATVKGEVDMSITPIEKVVYTAKAHTPGCLRAANADWQEQDRDIAFREV